MKAQQDARGYIWIPVSTPMAELLVEMGANVQSHEIPEDQDKVNWVRLERGDENT